MTLYLYQVAPIDFWFGWIPLRDVLIEALEQDEGEYDGPPDFGVLYDRLRRAKTLARQYLGWEGDMRSGPYFAPIPFETGFYEYLIAWKQDNNGTTYVASPVQLPWLETPDAEWIDDTASSAGARAKVKGINHSAGRRSPARRTIC
jgi:hypothetical protein